MTDWRPIETAPKDGTEIMIGGGTHYYDAETFPQSLPFDRVKIVYWTGDGWFGGYGHEYDGAHWHFPTHWMPLPPPPKDGEG